MAHNTKYDHIDHIDAVFAPNPGKWPGAAPNSSPFAAPTISTALGGNAESPRSSRSNGSSFSGILHEHKVLDTIRSAIDGNSSLFRFGGLLFRGKNSHNGDVVAHAVEDMTQGEARNLVSDRYFDLTTDHSDLFLTYDRSMEIDRHVVFTFRLPQGYFSLRELLNAPKSPDCGEIIFRRLVALLAKYQEITSDLGHPYRPLCCISLDTVFISRAGNDLKLVPLLPRHHDFPPYYPGEAGEKTADQRTDLYTAALTALQFMSGIELETDTVEMADCSGTPGMDDCLQVLQSRRPDIHSVQALLQQNSPDTACINFENFVGIDGERKQSSQKSTSVREYLHKYWPRRKKETATFSGILRNEK